MPGSHQSGLVDADPNGLAEFSEGQQHQKPGHPDQWTSYALWSQSCGGALPLDEAQAQGQAVNPRSQIPLEDANRFYRRHHSSESAAYQDLFKPKPNDQGKRQHANSLSRLPTTASASNVPVTPQRHFAPSQTSSSSGAFSFWPPSTGSSVTTSDDAHVTNSADFKRGFGPPSQHGQGQYGYMSSQPPSSAGPTFGYKAAAILTPEQSFDSHGRPASLGQMRNIGSLQQFQQHQQEQQQQQQRLQGVHAVPLATWPTGDMDFDAQQQSASSRTGVTPGLAQMSTFSGPFDCSSHSLPHSHGMPPSSSQSSDSFASFFSAAQTSQASSSAHVSPTKSPSEHRSLPSSVSMTSRNRSLSSHDSCATSSSWLSEDRMSFDTALSHWKPAKRKVKLVNADRKRICLFAEMHPHFKQEELASRFGIERSTVSKVLKHKDRWLAVDDDSVDAQIVKHRPARFPELEGRLAAWAHQMTQSGQYLSDQVIKDQALLIARSIGGPMEAFKASGGWIEKFRVRNGLVKDQLTMKQCDPLEELDDGFFELQRPSMPSSSSMPGSLRGSQSSSQLSPFAHGWEEPSTPVKRESLASAMSGAPWERPIPQTTPTSKQKRHYENIASCVPLGHPELTGAAAYAAHPEGTSSPGAEGTNMMLVMPQTKRRRSSPTLSSNHMFGHKHSAIIGRSQLAQAQNFGPALGSPFRPVDTGDPQASQDAAGAAFGVGLGLGLKMEDEDSPVGLRAPSKQDASSQTNKNRSAEVSGEMKPNPSVRSSLNAAALNRNSSLITPESSGNQLQSTIQALEAAGIPHKLVNTTGNQVSQQGQHSQPDQNLQHCHGTTLSTRSSHQPNLPQSEPNNCVGSDHQFTFFYSPFRPQLPARHASDSATQLVNSSSRLQSTGTEAAAVPAAPSWLCGPDGKGTQAMPAVSSEWIASSHNASATAPNRSSTRRAASKAHYQDSFSSGLVSTHPEEPEWQPTSEEALLQQYLGGQSGDLDHDEDEHGHDDDDDDDDDRQHYGGLDSGVDGLQKSLDDIKHESVGVDVDVDVDVDEDEDEDEGVRHRSLSAPSMVRDS